MNEEQMAEKITGLEKDVGYLKERDRQQNGTIQTVNAKTDTLIVEVTKLKAASIVLNILSPIAVGLIVYLLTGK